MAVRKKGEKKGSRITLSCDILIASTCTVIKRNSRNAIFQSDDNASDWTLQRLAKPASGIGPRRIYSFRRVLIRRMPPLTVVLSRSDLIEIEDRFCASAAVPCRCCNTQQLVARERAEKFALSNVDCVPFDAAREIFPAN